MKERGFVVVVGTEAIDDMVLGRWIVDGNNIDGKHSNWKIRNGQI